MNKEVIDILTDILELIERLARGYDENDIIDYLKNTYKKLNNIEVTKNE